VLPIFLSVKRKAAFSYDEVDWSARADEFCEALKTSPEDFENWAL
jgi:hypothetical protein